MKKYSKDYYRERFQNEGTDRLRGQYAKLDLTSEASDAIYEILSQRGEVVPYKSRTQESPDEGIVMTGCLVVALPIFLIFMMLIFIVVGDGFPIGGR